MSTNIFFLTAGLTLITFSTVLPNSVKQPLDTRSVSTEIAQPGIDSLASPTDSGNAMGPVNSGLLKSRTPEWMQGKYPALAGHVLGGYPYGSLLYSTSVAEFGWNMGTEGSGFHYQERGGYLAGILLSLLLGAAAQDQANRTKSDVEYALPSYEDYGKIGLNFDKRGDTYIADLLWSIVFAKDRLGLNKSKVITISRETPSILQLGFGGFPLSLAAGGVLPLGNWIQAEFYLRSQYYSLGFTANAGNYAFLRAQLVHTGDVNFTLGVRL